jgi:hypothetical protein
MTERVGKLNAHQQIALKLFLFVSKWNKPRRLLLSLFSIKVILCTRVVERRPESNLLLDDEFGYIDQCLLVFFTALDDGDKLEVIEVSAFDWCLLPYLLDLVF